MNDHSVVVVDFDGVIADTNRENKYFLDDVEPLPGAVEAMQRLSGRFKRVIIWTSRDANQEHEVKKWLERHGIFYTDIMFGKPWALVYIDDGAYRFKGWEKFWEDDVEEVLG